MTDAPIDRPTEAMMRSEPLGEDNVVLERESDGGSDNLGAGDDPDPDAPASESAPGGPAGERGKGQFDEAYRRAGSEISGSGS